MSFFPERKLVMWSSMVGLPFGTILGWSHDLRFQALVILILFIGLVLWDLRQIWNSFEKFTLERIEKLRLKVNQEEVLIFDIKGLAGTTCCLSLRIIGAIDLKDAFQIDRIKKGQLKASFSLLALERGDAHIEEIGIGVISPFGFWRHQKIVELNIPVQIFPHLDGNDPHLAALLHQLREGNHALRFTGCGQDFERLRLYEPGDAWSNINWKATARRRFPVTQLYRHEQSQDIVVLLDISRYAASAVVENIHAQRSVLDHTLQTALWLARFSECYGDRIGLLCYDNTVRHFLKPNRGKNHYAQCLEILYHLSPSARLPDYGELFSTLCYKIPKRSLVICLGQMPDATTRKALQQSLAMALRQHLFILAHMRGTWERPVLTGQALSHPMDLYETIAGHLSWNDHQVFALECRGKGAEFIHASPENYTLELLKRYLHLKAKSRL